MIRHDPQKKRVVISGEKASMVGSIAISPMRNNDEQNIDIINQKKGNPPRHSSTLNTEKFEVFGDITLVTGMLDETNSIHTK